MINGATFGEIINTQPEDCTGWFFKSIKPPQSFIWIWKSKCAPKLKFFMWLLQMDRLNTRNMLRRRNHPQFQLPSDCICVLCSNTEEETRDHLFFGCPFSTRCWQLVGIQWQQAPTIYEPIVRTKLHFQ